MKTKTLYILLAVFAAACGVLGAMPALVSEAFAGVMAFPFEQIGMGLRALSLSGGAGNAAAIVIYVLICLLPIGAAVLRRRRHGFNNADWLLLIFSAVLFGVIYVMVNPSLLGKTNLGAGGISVMKSVVGGCCWSIVVAWAVLELLRRSAEGGRERTLRQLSLMAYVLAFFFIALAFGGGASDLSASLEGLKGKTNLPGIPTMSMGSNVSFVVLNCFSAALPYVLDALVAVRGAQLLSAMSSDAYGEETVARAESLSRLCTVCLKITVITCAVVNLIQLAGAKVLLHVDVNVVIPLMSIAFVLLTRTLLGLILENKALKDDNDLFI